MTEALQPDLSPVINEIYQAITDWFPNTKSEDRDELAHYIAVDVLHIQHVAGELWSCAIDQPG